MERWRSGIDRQPQRRCRNPPSFSSTLLDAIYRSIDETDSSSAAKQTPAKKQNPASQRAIIPPSSSSDGSSYGGFSSSDAESASTPRLTRPPPIRTTPAVRSDPFSAPEKRDKKENQGSIRSYLRELRNGRSPRLTNFLTSLFAAKSKVSAESCLSKTPSTAKVTVIVGGDRRTAGEKRAPATARPVRRGRVEVEEEEDLFELKNLGFIGRFRDELPVYETTLMGKYGGVSRGVIV